MRECSWGDHLNQVGNSVKAQIARIRAATEHTTIKGYSIEAILRKVLTDYLPALYAVGTGQVASNDRGLTGQLDVLVYDRTTFPHLAVNEDSSVVICCEALYAVVECKSAWRPCEVAAQFDRLKEVEEARHDYFQERAGYFVFVVDPLKRPALRKLEAPERFVGVYSLNADRSWISPVGSTEFDRRERASALELFVRDLLRDCMDRNMPELGDHQMTFEAVRSYFGWDPSQNFRKTS